MTFTVGVAQDLPLPDGSFYVVTCTLAMHHVPARQRAAAFREMYRVTKSRRPPAGRGLRHARPPFLLHAGGRRMRRAAATVGPLEAAAAAAWRPGRVNRAPAPAALRRGHPHVMPGGRSAHRHRRDPHGQIVKPWSFVMGAWCLAAAGSRRYSPRRPRPCWRAAPPSSLPRAARSARKARGLRQAPPPLKKHLPRKGRKGRNGISLLCAAAGPWIAPMTTSPPGTVPRRGDEDNRDPPLHACLHRL